MIENADWENILVTAKDFSQVCELYPADAVPADDGFDPGDALACYAATSGVTFMGVEYTRAIQRFGRTKRTITKEINTASVTFSNVSREIATFEFTQGFEGLIMVIRLISRGRSTTLGRSQILFAGRCDRPRSGDKDALTVTAKFILGGMDEVVIPRRNFGPEDYKGRVPSDPEFEGFLFSPQYGTVTYTRIEKRGGFLGWWNKKQVIATMNWSSYSGLNDKKSVPEVFGRTQIMGSLIAAADVGVDIQMRVAFCEGPIQDIIDARSTDTALPISVASGADILRGLVGTANTDNPSWVGPGYYSRTAYLRCKAGNSGIDVTDPAPDVVAVIEGRILTVPDSGGDWVDSGWSNNAAAATWFICTNEDYFNLNAAWIDTDYATACFDFNKQLIFNTSINDFVFVEQGT